jgi:hypothetical protein
MTRDSLFRRVSALRFTPLNRVRIWWNDRG